MDFHFAFSHVKDGFTKYFFWDFNSEELGISRSCIMSNNNHVNFILGSTAVSAGAFIGDTLQREESGKSEYEEKNLLEKSREPTSSTHI